MTRALTMTGLVMLTTQFWIAADAAPIPRDGDLALAADEASRSMVLDLDGRLPGQITLGGQTVRDMTVHRAGVLVLGDNGLAGDMPMGLADLGMATVIAPFWAPLQGEPCPDGSAPGAVRRTDTDDGIIFAWLDVPLAGCPEGAESATFSVELMFDDRGVVREMAFRYESLPTETLVVEPRAGFRVQRVGAAAVFELFPDGQVRPQRGRAKLLIEGSSDGDPGVWAIEVGARGQIVGEREPDFVDEDGQRRRPDGWREADNCPSHFNPLQEDLDGDGVGDVCDLDADQDGIFDADNCPRIHNRGQSDNDGDGLGDVCDADDDQDGWPDDLDLCPLGADPSNGDIDGDGRGDVCDSDPDGDDRLAAWWLRDRCPFISDPERRDTDKDGLGDLCDLSPAAPCRFLCRWELDSDGDRIGDMLDLCPRVWDPDQLDQDGDGRGDACDADRDGNGILDVIEYIGDRTVDPIPWELDPDWMPRP